MRSGIERDTKESGIEMRRKRERVEEEWLV